MSSVAVQSRIIEQSAEFRRAVARLRTTTALAALAAILPASALADGCQTVTNTNCSFDVRGADGAAAQPSGAPKNGNGHDGGSGTGADDVVWIVDGIHYVDDPVQPVPLSPINIFTRGGTGAQGSDATAGLSGKNGGNGGDGGDGGAVGLITGAGMSGSTTTIASGITVFSFGGDGGAGAFGNLDVIDSPKNGVGGTGGSGHDLHLTLDGMFPSNLDNQSYGVFAATAGGAGGNGRDWAVGLKADGPNAGSGGSGGNVVASLLGTFVGNRGGVYLTSQGGSGGNGGNGEQVDGSSGGNGGNGGNAGEVMVSVGAKANIASFAQTVPGLLAASIGGTGGSGGAEGGTGGTAGSGGNASDVSVTILGGSISGYGGFGSPGILAQSLGGNGGAGGSASHFVIGPNGGAGSNGGTPGQTSVTGTGLVLKAGFKDNDPTDYSLAPGILAQSIGGGGGAGSDSKGFFAVGGDGGNAVAGNTASVDIEATITVAGTNSDGIAVQSIGGGGGKGGDAQGSGVEVQMTLGGLGGGGGNGGTATVQSRAGSVIETSGTHGHGILVQSVGGGGGAGGAAYSKSHNLFYGASIALGGSGGNGGGGGTVGFVADATTSNGGRITTTGSDAYGIIGQSIGGGGGIGGASTASSKTYSKGEYPGLSLAMAIGGSGGAGGGGGNVTLDNVGLVATSGAGSVGILGQSVGGGGGAGGDASSSSTASSGDISLAASFSMGGRGAGAGAGGKTTISNRGLIVTTGESADAMLVQSIGGGGGAGGAGDGESEAGDQKSLSLTMTLGGTAGGGGDGGAVTANNTGAIITLGDSAFGIGAQTIGGGGGRGGGAAGSAKGQFSAAVSLGASGGGGGNTIHRDGQGNQTSLVTVNNASGATIVTFGNDANGIIAQSIGGGGGVAGKAGSTIGTKKSTKDGGNGDATGTQTTFDAMAAGFDTSGLAGLAQYVGINGAVTTVNSLLANGTTTLLLGGDDVDAALDTTSQSKGATQDNNESTSIGLTVGLGGSGGNGGNAGGVVVNNNGEVATLGHLSDAILAQAIGGGGGKGGAASTATGVDYNGSLSVGGTGGLGGWGNEVQVSNAGRVITKGALAAGIVAQSIAGGGGIGGASASTIKAGDKNDGNTDADDGAFRTLAISLGGNGGAYGESGQAVITSSGAISTTAHDAAGIIAQSIAGGGGIVRTLATDKEAAGGTASIKDPDYTLGNFKFGGKDASGGNSGEVNVSITAGGSINTKGDNSHGIVAQSIAGGGGLALGGKPSGSSANDFFGSGKHTGSALVGVSNPDNAGVYVNIGDNITTSGEGAVGVFAQSVGGGGGIAGDIGWTMQLTQLGQGNGNFNGNGGDMRINVAAGSTIATSGQNAPAIIAQSIGGGGGWIANTQGAFVGSAGGAGNGGLIFIDIEGAVKATGAASMGIFAQSTGGAANGGVGVGSPVAITVGTGGAVYGGDGYGDAAAAIHIDRFASSAGLANTIDNNGFIVSNAKDNNGISVGTALYGTGSGTTTINNYKSIDGSVNFVGGTTAMIVNHGNIIMGPIYNLGLNGALQNVDGGIVQPYGGALGTTVLTGNYSGSGTLVLDADFAAVKGDKLVINGSASIGGTVVVNPVSISNKALTVLTATGGVTLDPALRSVDSVQLFDFTPQAGIDGRSLIIQPKANFAMAAAALGGNRQSAATNLQLLFDSGASFDRGFAALLKVSDAANYASSLDALSGQALGALGAFRINASRAFIGNLYGGCERHGVEGDGEGRCVWARAFYTATTQDENTNELGYHAKGTGFQLGGETRLTDSWYLSGAVAYENSRFRDDDRTARIKGDGVLGGFSLRYAKDRLELSGALDAGYGWYRSRRQIVLGNLADVARAKPDQWEVGAHANAGYTFDLGRSGYARPYADLHVIHVHSQSFAETGNSPFNLAVDAKSQTAVAGGVGLEIGGRMPLKGGASLRPFASAGVELASNSDWTTTARFVGQSSDSFDIRTAAPTTYGRFAVGLELLGAKNVDLSVAYNPELGKDYVSHAGLAKLTCRF